VSVLKMLKERVLGGHPTSGWPNEPVELPERFRGRPLVDPSKCDAAGAEACARVCPTGALSSPEGRLTLDLGRCTFCGECEREGPGGAVRFTRDPRLAVRRREELELAGEELLLATALDEKMRALFGRSLKLRQVSAGGCSGCEAELVATGNIIFDLSRFGIQFVASPRHADGLVITGPVSDNMKLALEKTWAALPEPRIVIAVGACAISGGVFRGSEATHDGASSVVPVDLFIPGCPPHPITVLDGLLRLLGRLPTAGSSSP
jgi:Ni,Fe-hydrogenase III small subunit/formate hydrogenlyase subunit 6/NADH:ubiquinone oxidoreductase subunit I